MADCPDFNADGFVDALRNPKGAYPGYLNWSTKKKLQAARGGTIAVRDDGLVDLTWQNEPRNWARDAAGGFARLRVVYWDGSDWIIQLVGGGKGDMFWPANRRELRGIDVSKWVTPGDCFALMWCGGGTEQGFDYSESRTDFRGMKYPKEVEPPPVPGNLPPGRWPMGRAPQMVLGPDLPRLTFDWVDGLFDHFMTECGFDGYHIACERELPNDVLRYLIERCNAYRPVPKHVHLWIMDDADAALGPAFLAHTTEFLELLPDTPNVSVGPRYDVQELDTPAPDVARWVVHCQSVAPGRLYGARAGSSPAGPYTIGTPYNGSYRGFEFWAREALADWDKQVRECKAAAAGYPAFAEDRYRWRDLFEKDLDSVEELAEKLGVCRRYEVAASWGKQQSSGAGSQPFGAAGAALINAANNPGGVVVPPIGGSGVRFPKDRREFSFTAGGTIASHGGVDVPNKSVKWPSDVVAVEIFGGPDNAQPWDIFAVSFFNGKREDMPDDVRGDVYLGAPNGDKPGWKRIAKSVREVTGDPSPYHEFREPYRLDTKADRIAAGNGVDDWGVRLKARHVNVSQRGTFGNPPFATVGSAAHVTVYLYAKLVPATGLASRARIAVARALPPWGGR